jgi:hypothetical protein
MRFVKVAVVVLLGVLPALAAPPVVPAELSAPVGEPTLLTVTAEQGKKVGTAKTFDTGSLMLARLWSNDPNVYEFWVFPKKAGTYYVPFWTEGETAGVTVKVVAGNGEAEKPTPPDPVPTPETRFYFAVVRADGPVAPSVRDALSLSAWDEVRSKGHYVKDFEASKLPAGLSVPSQLPGLVKLKQNSDGKTFEVLETLPMPTTNDAVKELLK